MIELINRNLSNSQPDFFYRVSEFVTTFGEDESKNDPFSHFEEFKGNDLLKARAEAYNYYWKRLQGLESGRYFLPYASPKDFERGKNAAFSITLSFVEYYEEEDQIEHPLLGEDDEAIAESKRIEVSVLLEKGYNLELTKYKNKL